MATLSLPNFTLGIPVWYLDPPDQPVMDTLSLPKFTLGIPVWYLDPPAQPTMPQVVLTPMQPIMVEPHPPPSLHKPIAAPVPAPPQPKRARGKNTKAIVEPRKVPPCAVCEQQGHPTQNCLEMPVIHAHVDAMDTNEKIPVVELPTVPLVKNKALRTNHACTLCVLYGHYSHHFQDLPKF